MDASGRTLLRKRLAIFPYDANFAPEESSIFDRLAQKGEFVGLVVGRERVLMQHDRVVETIAYHGGKIWKPTFNFSLQCDSSFVGAHRGNEN